MSFLDQLTSFFKSTPKVLKQTAVTGIVPAISGFQALGQAAQSPTVKRIANTPIKPGSVLDKLNTVIQTTNRFATTAPVISDLGYKIPSQYGANQIAKPIAEVIKNPTPLNALGAVGGAISATPVGVGWNLAVGTVGGAARAARTKQNLGRSISQGIS